MSYLSRVSKPFLKRYWIGPVMSITPALSPPPPDGLAAFGPLYDLGDAAALTHRTLRSCSRFALERNWAFGAWVDGELAAFCWFLSGEPYRQSIDFWPLEEDEAELAEVITLPKFRGRGIAPAVIEYGVARMGECGYRRFFARIWHSNHASLSAFRKAGWKQVAFVVEIWPRLMKRRFRLYPRLAIRAEVPDVQVWRAS